MCLRQRRRKAAVDLLDGMPFKGDMPCEREKTTDVASGNFPYRL